MLKLETTGNESNHTIISFFSGAGFLDLGFEDAGFEVAYVNEIFEPFMQAYKYSRQHMGIKPPAYGYSQDSIENLLSGPQNKVIESIINDSRVGGKLVGFIGGPPCPDFSVGGKNKGKSGENGKLTGIYVDLILKNRPDFFLFENVKGLWRTKKHREFYDSLKGRLKKGGYILCDNLVNAISYGVPQDRDRIILFGIKEDLVGDNEKGFDWDKYSDYPDRTAFDFNWPDTSEFIEGEEMQRPEGIPEDLTVEYWFKKNDVESHANSLHSFRPKAGLAKFQVIAEGDDSKKSYKRLHRWRYSPTACYGNNEVHLHPYFPRRISVAEALAIQSLPKEFELPPEMTLTNMFKTIGNGVPYKAAHSIARTIKDYINEVVYEESDSIEFSECNRKVAAE